MLNIVLRIPSLLVVREACCFWRRFKNIDAVDCSLVTVLSMTLGWVKHKLKCIPIKVESVYGIQMKEM